MIVSVQGIQLTPDDLRPIEADLLGQTNGCAAVWCGRAGTALYWTYRLAMARRPEVERPEIIMPAMMCATPANAGLLAGATLRFADNDPTTGLATLATIQARASENTVAVVIVHLLGHSVNVAPIAAWCRQKNILLIEDAAQAQGARLPDESPVGSHGDVVAYSFNSTKILESGGGALVVNNPECVEPLERLLRDEPLPPEPPTDTLAQLGLSYRNLHHSLAGLLRMGTIHPADVSPLFLRVQSSYDALLLRPAHSFNRLVADWPTLPERLARRYQRAEQYAEALAGGPWRLLDGWRSSGVCWRFSLLLDEPAHVVSLSDKVRKDGFHVSNLYWPAHQFFNPADACPGADHFGARVVNLWVDDSVNEGWIERCCASAWYNAESLALSN